MGLEQWLGANQWVLFGVLLWTLPWKGIALWKAARRGDQRWFVVLLILNTLAILELIYIFIVTRRSKEIPASQTGL